MSGSWRRGGRTCAIAAVVAASLAAQAGSAAGAPAGGYECRPRAAHMATPPPPPSLNPQAAERLRAAREADEFRPLCPAGEVPYPAGGPEMVKPVPPGGQAASGGARASRVSLRRYGRGGRPGRHRRGARASRQSGGGAWYSWAVGWQDFPASKGVNGLWITQTNEQPYIDYQESLNYAHSLAQLWAIGWPGTDPNCWSTAETGWSESAGVYGDVEPHLFVYAYDCGVRIGEAGGALPWVQASNVVYPRAVVSHNDRFHDYGARLDGNNWWIYYDGEWVGYIPNGAWHQYFPWVVKEVETGGEVETPNYSTCTDMGYGGLFGTHPWAAMFLNVNYEYNYNTQWAHPYLTKYESDPSNYDTGNWGPSYPGYEFRYGGPGWC